MTQPERKGHCMLNFKRMQERRVVFTTGVSYETPPDTIAKIPAMLREAVEAQQQVRFDRSHFVSYGESALNFETVYFVLAADYLVYANVNQAVNLAVLSSLGPIVAFFSVSTESYGFMIILNVLTFALSGVLGFAFLLQTLNRLYITQLKGSFPPPLSSASAPSAPQTKTPGDSEELIDLPPAELTARFDAACVRSPVLAENLVIGLDQEFQRLLTLGSGLIGMALAGLTRRIV